MMMTRDQVSLRLESILKDIIIHCLSFVEKKMNLISSSVISGSKIKIYNKKNISIFNQHEWWFLTMFHCDSTFYLYLKH